MERKYLTAAIGEALWDIYPEGKFPGGATFNYIHHIRQLGHEGILFSRLGDDPEGRELLEFIKKSGHDTGFIRIDQHNPTGYVRVFLDENKVPGFRGADAAAYYYLEYDMRFPEVKDKIDAVLFGTYTQRTPQVMDVTNRYLGELESALKIFDVNFRWWNDKMEGLVTGCMDHADILKMNEDEYEKICGLYNLSGDRRSNLEKLIDKFKLKTVCLTLGEYGCLISNRNDIVYCPGLSVDVVDTTGAGDAFIAAMTIGYLEGRSLRETGEYANTVAAYTSMKQGAVPEYTMEDITSLRNGCNNYNFVKEIDGL
ncbi:carbohydrate kinase [candidate division KSB1 bacterium]